MMQFSTRYTLSLHQSWGRTCGCCRNAVSQNSIFLFGIKARAGLEDVGKVAVTEDDGMGIAFLEVLEHKQQGSFLCRSTGVIILASFIDATLVADADAAVVVAFHVGTCLVF